MEAELLVTITHFINPHLFWFKTVESDRAEHVHVLKSIEDTLDQLFKNKPLCDNQLRPQIGDKVAVNFIAWNKYIRAEILQKAEFQQEEYIVWAIDYGFPLLTKKDYLRYLPTNLSNNLGHIQMGGISGIYPAEQEYDDEECNLVLVKKGKWLQKTCNMLEKLLTDASSISFIKRYETPSNFQKWGDLIVINHRGNKINAIDLLIKTTNAMEEKNLSMFQENCSKLNTTKIAPWLSNNRNTKMKNNTIKHNYAEHSRRMAAALIDEQAKRKVEDWQKRNEVKTFDEFSEIPETVCVLENTQYEDEVAFDDSVSVAHEKNYIGKAGAIQKAKQNFKDNIPISVLENAFQMDGMPATTDNNTPTFQSSALLPSTSSNISVRLQKLAESRSTKAKNRYKEKVNKASVATPFQMQDALSLVSNSDSTDSSFTKRHQILREMRNKTAHSETQYKNTESNDSEANTNFEPSVSSATTTRHQKLLEMRKKTAFAEKKYKNSEINVNSEPSVSSTTSRHQKLLEMRKKTARSPENEVDIQNYSSFFFKFWKLIFYKC